MLSTILPDEPDHVACQIPGGPVRTTARAVATTLITGLETDGSLRFRATEGGSSTPGPRTIPISGCSSQRPGQQQRSPERTDARHFAHRTTPRFARRDIGRFQRRPRPRQSLHHADHWRHAEATHLSQFVQLAGVWSADGQRIAFASTQGGKPRVWTIAPAVSPASAVLGRLERQLRSHLGPRLAHPLSAGRQSQLLRARSRDGEERLLVKDSSVGWMFSPVYSPEAGRLPWPGIGARRGASGSSTPRPSRDAGVHDRGASLCQSGGPPMALDLCGRREELGLRGLTAPLGETMTDAKILIVPLNGGEVKTLAALPSKKSAASP